MDVLYYWKNFDADLKANRIGYFKSEARKLQALHDGFPDFIWVVKTPEGRKGEVQILGRLRWLDKAAAGIKTAPAQTHIYYDPTDHQSVQSWTAARRRRSPRHRIGSVAISQACLLPTSRVPQGKREFVGAP